MADDARLRAIFEHANDAIFVVDPAHDAILDCNPAACRMLGYEREALLARPMSAIHPGETERLSAFVRNVRAAGHGWTDALTCTASDGRRIPAEISASPVDDAGCLVALVRDTSSRRAAESAALRFRTALDHAGDPILLVDPASGRILDVNATTSRLLGLSREELLARRLADLQTLVKFQTPEGWAEMMAAVRAQAGPYVVERIHRRRDGTTFPVEMAVVRHEIDGAPMLVVTVRDLTDRRAAEEHARARARLERENAYLREEVRTELAFGEVVGEHAALRRVLEQIALVAPTDSSVLIQGESGTGKELVARAIHAQSARADGPLVRVNCGAVPRELFESEFFGHVRGAFTGAVRDRTGRFELADGGTLFLDEVGEIPLELQAKLLRVLQDGEFEPVGEERTRRASVRVLAATNRDLHAEVDAGRFRRDLYYRLSVFPITVPPLRERSSDVPALVAHFVRAIAARLGRAPRPVPPEDLERLQAYDWPGNVRELQNVVERAVILAGAGPLRLAAALPSLGAPAAEPRTPVAGAPAASAPTPGRVLTAPEMERLERDNIVAALAECGGRLYGAGGAAARLGLKPTTLASRMKRLSIEKPR